VHWSDKGGAHDFCQRSSAEFSNSDPKTGKDVDGIRAYTKEFHNLPLDQKVTSAILGGTTARLLKLVTQQQPCNLKVNFS
jgi:hypothetical protein